MWQEFPLSPPSVNSSSLLRPLLFTSHTSKFYSHMDHYVYPLESRIGTELEVIRSNMTSTSQDKDSVAMETKPILKRTLMECVATDVPRVLFSFMPRVCEDKNKIEEE